MLCLEETHLSIAIRTYIDSFWSGIHINVVCIEYVTLLQCTHIEVGRGLEYVIVHIPPPIFEL